MSIWMSFFENQPFYPKTSLQGESENEALFWEEEPLPSPVLHLHDNPDPSPTEQEHFDLAAITSNNPPSTTEPTQEPVFALTTTEPDLEPALNIDDSRTGGIYNNNRSCVFILGERFHEK